MKAWKISCAGMLAAFAVASYSGNVAAQDGATLVKERIDLMRSMGKAFRIVMPVVKGENPKVADALPGAMAWHEGAKKVLAAFPAGTGRDKVADSRAKPEVWSKRAEFEAAANKMVDESAKMVAAVKSNDVEAVQEQFKPFVSSCGGCHSGKGKEGGKFRFAKE